MRRTSFTASLSVLTRESPFSTSCCSRTSCPIGDEMNLCLVPIEHNVRYFKHSEVSNYKVSVPYRKVRSDKGKEVILAWGMNGEDLPRSHGQFASSYTRDSSIHILSVLLNLSSTICSQGILFELSSRDISELAVANGKQVND